MSIKDNIKKIKFINNFVKNSRLKKAFLKDYQLFKDNYMYSHEDAESIGYNILLIVHTTEKAMTNKKPRVFGKEKIKTLMLLLDKYEKYENKDNYYYQMGISCLNEYKTFFEKQNWQSTDEYFAVEQYLEKKNLFITKPLNIGSSFINKNDIIKYSKINYENFLKSRHSTRNYSKKKLKDDDINMAINMAIYTPSACNRQMCKIYYVDSKRKREDVIKYANGFGNFELDNINIFLITYDVRSLSMAGERNQGWINSGLIAMNFVNALHSLGIGTCLLQSSNTYEEEQNLKDKLGICSSERIAVIISAGYYDDVSIITNSIRKKNTEIYKKI